MRMPAPEGEMLVSPSGVGEKMREDMAFRPAPTAASASLVEDVKVQEGQREDL